MTEETIRTIAAAAAIAVAFLSLTTCAVFTSAHKRDVMKACMAAKVYDCKG